MVCKNKKHTIMQLNEEQAAIVTQASGQLIYDNIVVQASAGTGKSFTLAKLVTTLAKDKMCAALVCAPTAIAAQQIPPGFVPTAGRLTHPPACTVASLLTPFAKNTMWSKLRLSAQCGRLGLVHILVDEYAMLGGTDFERLVAMARGSFLGTRARYRFVLFGDTKQLPAVESSILDSGEFISIMAKTARCFTLSTSVRWDPDSPYYEPLHRALVDGDANAVGGITRSLWPSAQRPVPYPGLTDCVFVAYTNEEADAFNAKAVALIAHGRFRTVYLLVDPKTGACVQQLVQTGTVIGTKNRKEPASATYLFANKQTGVLESMTGTRTECADAAELGVEWKVESFLLNGKLEATVTCADGSVITLPAMRIDEETPAAKPPSRSIVAKLAAGTKKRKRDTDAAKCRPYSLFLKHGYGRTINAVQGQTITSKYVVALARVPSWEALYVALTRCTALDTQMYILPWDDSDRLNMILDRPRSPGLLRFYRSFQRNLVKGVTP